MQQVQVLHIIKKHSGSKEPKDANGQEVKAVPIAGVVVTCLALHFLQVTKGRAKLAVGNIRKKPRTSGGSALAICGVKGTLPWRCRSSYVTRLALSTGMSAQQRAFASFARPDQTC